MNLQERFFEMTATLRDQAGAMAALAAEVARDGAERAADQVLAAQMPVQRLADVAQALLADGAKRLRVLAKTGKTAPRKVVKTARTSRRKAA